MNWLLSPTADCAQHMELGFDVALLVSTLAVVVGLIGEYRKGEWWKQNLHIFEMLVLLGVAGEMLMETGAFWYSEKLQNIQSAAIATAQNQANDAARDAGHLGVTVDGLHSFVTTKQAEAEQRLTELKGVVGDNAVREDRLVAEFNADKERFDKAKSDALASAAEAKKAQLEMATALASEREAGRKLQELLAPRELREAGAATLISKLKVFVGQQYAASVPANDPEARSLWNTLDKVLSKAGWRRVDPTGAKVGDPPAGISLDQGPGIQVAVEPNSSNTATLAALKLAECLNDAKLTSRAERVTPQFEPRPSVILINLGPKPH